MGIDSTEARRKRKGKYNFPFSPLARDLLGNPVFWGLTPTSRKLYEYLLMSYRSGNNGKLIAPFSVLHDLGIVGSELSLSKGLKELRDKGFIRLIAVGAKKQHLANRYAIINPDLPIDWNPKDFPEVGYYKPP